MTVFYLAINEFTNLIEAKRTFSTRGNSYQRALSTFINKKSDSKLSLRKMRNVIAMLA